MAQFEGNALDVFNSEKCLKLIIRKVACKGSFAFIVWLTDFYRLGFRFSLLSLTLFLVFLCLSIKCSIIAEVVLIAGIPARDLTEEKN